ncbi:MAG: hypothetical protein AABX16_04925 [Nanoarchaeota archaeon]
MTDIFDNKIVCKNCNEEMKPVSVNRNGFALRAIECNDCKSRIIHPHDEQKYQNFMTIKKKEFNVKMRFVGNSYAVSIPREIVDFIKEHERMMNDMVKLCFEDFGKVSLDFGCKENNTHISSVDDNLKNVRRHF